MATLTRPVRLLSRRAKNLQFNMLGSPQAKAVLAAMVVKRVMHGSSRTA